jgi:hypothetical protein
MTASTIESPSMMRKLMSVNIQYSIRCALPLKSRYFFSAPMYQFISLSLFDGWRAAVYAQHDK